MSEPACRLQSHLADYRSAKQHATSVIPSVPDELFVQKPSEQQWAPAECYDHLCNVGNMYLVRIQNSFANYDGSQTAEEPFHHGWLMNKLINLMEPPYRFRMKAPKGFGPQPVSELQKEEVYQRYISLQDTFIDLLQQYNNFPMDDTKISSPVSIFIRMNISEALAFTAAHQRRHMWQADQILQRLAPVS